jgi:hypothetical protein
MLGSADIGQWALQEVGWVAVGYVTLHGGGQSKTPAGCLRYAAFGVRESVAN